MLLCVYTVQLPLTGSICILQIHPESTLTPYDPMASSSLVSNVRWQFVYPGPQLERQLQTPAQQACKACVSCKKMERNKGTNKHRANHGNPIINPYKETLKHSCINAYIKPQRELAWRMEEEEEEEEAGPARVSRYELRMQLPALAMPTRAGT